MKLFDTKITKIIKETSDSYSFVCEIPEGYTWKAGQHALWELEGIKLPEDEKKNRIFTIASAPEDGFLMFTTRIAEKHSPFKDALLNEVKEGTKVKIAEALGNFAFGKDAKKSFVIAGGIGITPIRSLLRDFSEKNDEKHEITVLYSDDRGEFAYKDFWKEIEPKMPNLDLKLISDRNEFTDSVNDFAKKVGNDSEYLIAGSPGMNAAFTETLTGLGVDKKNIITDNFMGY